MSSGLFYISKIRGPYELLFYVTTIANVANKFSCGARQQAKACFSLSKEKLRNLFDALKSKT